MSKRRVTKFLAGLVIALILSAAGASITRTGEIDLPVLQAHTKPGYYQVSEVSDGDTISVDIAGKKETIRLVGIDTPETRDPRTTVQCFGIAASSKTKELLNGSLVRLEADPESDDRDRYGRLLRYVYLEDGTFINQLLVQEGYAFAYTLFPNSKLEDFRRWEAEAKQNGRGLWSGCSVDESNQKKQTVGR